jgi:hypothetical protein
MYICLLHDIKSACCTIWSRCSSVNTETSLGAGGFKNRCRIPDKLRDFASLQNARRTCHGTHDMVSDSGQGEDIDEIQTDQNRCWAHKTFYSIDNTRFSLGVKAAGPWN